MTGPVSAAKRSYRVLPVIEHIFQLLIGNAGVLHRVSRVGVPQLALDGGNIAGLIDQVPSHGVAGIVRGVAFDLRSPADRVPDRIDHLGV